MQQQQTEIHKCPACDGFGKRTHPNGPVLMCMACRGRGVFLVLLVQNANAEVRPDLPTILKERLN